MTKAARGTLVGLVIVAVLGGIVLYFVAKGGSPTFRLPQSSGCKVSNAETEVRLDVTQMSNAATITAVGIGRKVPDRAVVVALATALQESKLENLDGGDRDSIGLFQQRPSQGWGTPDQIADPRYAAKKFYTALLKVKGWQKMRVTEAAQKVQRSAYPEAYQKWADEAEVIANALLGKVSAAVRCTLPDTDGAATDAAAIGSLAEAMKLDYGTITATPDDGAKAVLVSAADATRGWAYAHWLVARAADHRVASVTFAGRVWTADSGEWKPAAVNDASRVIAAL
ncbi:hypothetical protein AB0M47_25885 [Hamadaea sp. NPDC051192]|uniref:hypothetical protein n=1 Tax=Hamadaea sp. NPDC051192 TaxID=3154940 RepID=UPI00343DC461